MDTFFCISGIVLEVGKRVDIRREDRGKGEKEKNLKKKKKKNERSCPRSNVLTFCLFLSSFLPGDDDDDDIASMGLQLSFFF